MVYKMDKKDNRVTKYIELLSESQRFASFSKAQVVSEQASWNVTCIKRQLYLVEIVCVLLTSLLTQKYLLKTLKVMASLQIKMSEVKNYTNKPTQEAFELKSRGDGKTKRKYIMYSMVHCHWMLYK